ncbi:hypothetical protein OM076_07890 [Solirubrobacter ginsenosidimutans]|uniref:Uncharacterized protein n=1 Tax=Solirubrobacter ginsenosidimutans TaxID=490573 RepID=A0A9X3MPS6_9ACTN|nr:hypothetical protein [Solirubrobacter ginsenosidimutans]MDA0160179.1 hypothetical protein [Solirubrobacter ginsenosidimutans]
MASIAAEIGEPRTREPTTAVWREQAIAEITQMEFAVKWLTSPAHTGTRLDDETAREILAILDRAHDAAVDRSLGWMQRIKSTLRGASVERAWGHIDAAAEALVRAAPPEFVAGQLPRVERRVERALKCDDARRIHLREVARRYAAPAEGAAAPGPVTESDREVIATALHAANCEARRKQSRVRSFRNMLLIWGVVLTITATGLGILGFLKPDLALFCFQPSGQAVCPTTVAVTDKSLAVSGQPAAAQDPRAVAEQDEATRVAARKGDVLLIEAIGLAAAALAAAAAVRRIHGTSTPYGVPFAVAVVKLPSGALTAALGLLLMRANFVPGLSALDSPAQIIGWAIIFGYAQQLFTRLVDQRAQTVLDGAGPESPPREVTAVARASAAT